MKLAILLLLISCSVFSQTEKKKTDASKPKTELKKTTKQTEQEKKEQEKKKKEAQKKIDDAKKKSDDDAKKTKLDAEKAKKTIADAEKLKKEEDLRKNDSVIIVTKRRVEELPKTEINLSYKIGFRLLNACNTSKIKPFTEEELAPKLLKKISLDYISIVCNNNNITYGKFENIELKEVITIENTKTNIYRYKAIYEKKLFTKELRIYINKDGLVSVIKTLKWKDKYEVKKKKKPRPKKIIDSLKQDSINIIDESLIIRN